MKKEYVSPEAESISFVPDDELANAFWNTWGAGSSPLASGNPASKENGDIEIPIPPTQP